MRRSPALGPVAAVLSCLLAALLQPAPASAAARATSVALNKVPAATAPVGDSLVLAGKVKGGVKGQKVHLQRRTPTGWRTEDTKAISRTLAFRFTWDALEGRWSYRVAAPKTRRTRASASKAVTVKGVVSADPSFNVTELPDGYQGVMYRFDGFDARSGWDYSVVEGQLPPGLSLMEAPDEGYLDGTPTSPGTYDVTIRITAPGASPTERAFTIVVHPTGSWTDTPHRIAAVSNDGTRAVSGTTAYSTSEQDAAYLDLEAGTSTPIPSPVVPDSGSPDWTMLAPLDLSSDGRYVLLQYTAHYYPDLNWYWMFRWDSQTGNHLQIGEPQYQNPYEASISADGSVVAWTVDATFEVWEAGSASSTPVAGLPEDSGWYPVVASLSDDGRFLLFSLYPEMWLLDRQLGTFTLVDDSATLPGELSRDGGTVLYNDVVQTSPLRHVLMTWERASGSTAVVSRLADGTAVTNDRPYEAVLSGDGRTAFLSSDRGLGPRSAADGAADFDEPYVWDADTAQVLPLPMIPGTSDYPNLPDARDIVWTEPSHDGAVVGALLHEKYGNRGFGIFRLDDSWTG